MKMEQTECSETLAYKIQTPGNYPEESIQQFYFSLPEWRKEFLFVIECKHSLTLGHPMAVIPQINCTKYLNHYSLFS